MKLNRRKFIKKGLFATLGSYLLPNFILNNELNAKILSAPAYKPDPLSWTDEQVSLAWIGHSTVLIKLYDKWIITDPVLMDRIGLYFFGGSLGPSRITPPALTVEEIPKPDIILLSHAHMDHMDYPTLKAISEKYPNQIDVITAYLTMDVIEDLEWKSLTEIDWGESIKIHGIEFTALEVKHFGWRFPWEKDRSRGYFYDGRSFNAYLIKNNGTNILFGGDTAMTDKLRAVQTENIDIAIMPIGAYNPWKTNHCNPEEAMIMADEIKAKHFVPIHCKTFQQGREPVDEPLRWVRESSEKYAINLALDDIGKSFNLPLT